MNGVLGRVSDSDLYRVLGLSGPVSPEVVRHAYRELVRLHHPDSTPGARGDGLGSVVQAYRELGRRGLLAAAPVEAVEPRHIDVYA